MKATIKTFEKNSELIWVLIIFNDMAFLRILEGDKKLFKQYEKTGELDGDDLIVFDKNNNKITYEDIKTMNLKQLEYDIFIELYPEYRVKIENYIRWFKLQK